MCFPDGLGGHGSLWKILGPTAALRAARLPVDTTTQNAGPSQTNLDRYKAPRTNDQMPSKWGGLFN